MREPGRATIIAFIQKEDPMNVREIMTVGPLTVEPETTLADAGRIMLDQNLSALPVIDRGGRLLGIVTDGDMLRRPELETVPEIGWWRGFLAPETSARQFARTRGRHVGEIMTTPVRSVGPDTPLSDAIDIMETYHVKQLPVVQGEVLLGMLNRRNILSRLITALLVIEDTPVSDDVVATRIRAAIEKTNWAPKATIEVRVDHGVATLSGPVFSDAERMALIVLAEGIGGVRRVADEMVYVDPTSGVAFGSS